MYLLNVIVRESEPRTNNYEPSNKPLDKHGMNLENPISDTIDFSIEYECGTICDIRDCAQRQRVKALYGLWSSGKGIPLLTIHVHRWLTMEFLFQLDG